MGMKYWYAFAGALVVVFTVIIWVILYGHI